MIPDPAEELYAYLYDLYVSDWPGELDFFRELASEPLVQEAGLLEIGCGTGRVALRLARSGIQVTGLDLSPELLAVARQKGAGLANLRWIQADMRAFELGEKYGAVIIPGHSFQFMTTREAQMDCLGCIRRHLLPGGALVLHLDQPGEEWLAGLLAQTEPSWRYGSLLIHPVTGRTYRKANYWTYDPAAQTAANHIQWDLLNECGEVVQVCQMTVMPLWVPTRREVEALLHQAGYTIEAVYGDFFKRPLEESSANMIWAARNPAG